MKFLGGTILEHKVCQWKRHWQRSVVIQRVGHCCLDGYGAQGVV